MQRKPTNEKKTASIIYILGKTRSIESIEGEGFTKASKKARQAHPV